MKIILLISLSILTSLSIFFYPSIDFIVSMVILILSLFNTTYTIFQNHKGTENARAKISKETVQFVITLLLISFLAGLAGMFTNFYISNIFGAVAGFVCAMIAGIIVGYFVRKGISKVSG